MKSQNVSINEYFKKIGFSSEDIEFLNQFATNQIDLEVLHEKIKYLIFLGLSARQIRIIIEEDLIFATEPLELIKSNGTILQKYLNEEEMGSALEVTPELLTIKEGDLEQNIKLLKILIPNEEYLKIIIEDRGEILTYKPDYLSDKLSFLVNNGLKDEILSIIIQNIEIFDLNNDEIDLKSLKK